MFNGKPLICISSDMKKMESDPRRLITETYQTYSDAVFYAGGTPLAPSGPGPEAACIAGASRDSSDPGQSMPG